jgi:hypothetical protein
MSVEAFGSGEPAQLHNSTIPEENERDDVRADVVAAIEKLTKEQNTGESPEAAAEGEVQSTSTERPRNERGQFIKADGSVDPDQSATPVTDAGETQDKQQGQSSALEAPKGLSAEMRAKWTTLDPSVQAEFVRREQAIDNGGRQWSEEKRTYEQQLAPLGEFAQRYQIDNGTALTRLLDWQRALEQDPRSAIIQLAQLSGIDLNNPNQQPQPQNTAYDPRLDSLLPTIQQLEARNIQSQIDAFKASPGHDHFDSVSVKMGELMGAFPNKYPETQTGMEAAYQDALYLVPDVRESIIQARVTPAQQQASNQAQVAKAKAAASPKGSGPTGNAPKPKQEYNTVREAVEAAAREHGWAV